MLTIRKSQDRGQAKYSWLRSYHSFSFGNYYDPNHMGYFSLRVINHDWVSGGNGFGTHPHRDWEILSYVVEGSLEHRDSLGHHGIIKSQDVQLISAGTGISHSEYNHSLVDPVEFLQIWIKPNQLGLKPSYQQQSFSVEDKTNQLKLLISDDGHDDSMKIHQDVNLYGAIVDANHSMMYHNRPNRATWIQVVKGCLLLNNQIFSEGDGISFTETDSVELIGHPQTEILLFDLG